MSVDVISNVVSSTYQGSKSNLSKKDTTRNDEVVSEPEVVSASELAKYVFGENEHETNKTEQSSQIRKAVDDINKSVSGSQSEAIFGIHEETNRVTIKIVDKKSKKVLKEYPPEKTLDMIAKVWEMAGIMVDEKR